MTGVMSMTLADDYVLIAEAYRDSERTAKMLGELERAEMWAQLAVTYEDKARLECAYDRNRR